MVNILEYSYNKEGMKIKVERDLCRGLGNCVVLAPTVFKFDEENKAIILDPASVSDDELLKAAESCTENAIIIEDDQGSQLYP